MILNYQIRKMGFENVVAFESEFLTIGGVVIHKTKAIHGDSDKVVEKMGEVTGYIFEFPGEKRLYLATGYYPELLRGDHTVRLTDYESVGCRKRKSGGFAGDCDCLSSG